MHTPHISRAADTMHNAYSRRKVLKTGLLTASALSVGGLGLARSSAAQVPGAVTASNCTTSSCTIADLQVFQSNVTAAYTFLNLMMDAYASGSAVRLTRSFSDQLMIPCGSPDPLYCLANPRVPFASAFTYDNALAIQAYLSRGISDDYFRATVLGDALVYAQANDPYKDGRLRSAYFTQYVNANGVYLAMNDIEYGTFTGNCAWCGMALCQLYYLTRVNAYLTTAINLANWIVSTQLDTRGAGGFMGGRTLAEAQITWKATEHNIDCHAFFTMLAEVTGSDSWLAYAREAARFVEFMVASALNAPFLWTGTGFDGVTINQDPIPGDVQSWSYLALGKPHYAACLDWVPATLSVTDTPQATNSRLTGSTQISGITFSTSSLTLKTPGAPGDPPPDNSAVWLEGTSHIAAALLARSVSTQRTSSQALADQNAALGYLQNVANAQSLAQNDAVNGKPLGTTGIFAATSVLNDGEGDSYYPAAHVGATAWFVLAAQFANPFTLKINNPRR